MRQSSVPCQQALVNVLCMDVDIPAAHLYGVAQDRLLSGPVMPTAAVLPYILAGRLPPQRTRSGCGDSRGMLMLAPLCSTSRAAHGRALQMRSLNTHSSPLQCHVACR